MHKITGCLFFLFFIASPVFSQSFIITPPRLEFNGKTLNIAYDIISGNNTDLFRIWVEIYDQKGKPIIATTLRGETGDSIPGGANKKIEWNPADDGIYIDDDITVEVKGMMYRKEIRKGSLILQSLFVPGLGISKLRNGKPFWLLSVPAYGALAGGFITRQEFTKTYRKYRSEKDAVTRADFLKDAEKMNNMSGALFVTSAAIWAGNLIWITAAPDKSKKPNSKGLTINSFPYGGEMLTVVSFRATF